MNLTICNSCNKLLPNDDSFRNASTRVNNTVSYIHSKQHIICPTCVHEYLQLQRILRQEKNLLWRYTQNMKLHKYQWGFEQHNVVALNYVHNIFKLQEFKNDYLFSKLCEPMVYTIIEVLPIFENYKEISYTVMGASLPNNISIPLLNPNVIECPLKGFGVIKFPRGDDFLIIENSNFNEQSLINVSIEETRFISKGITSPRAGASGGFMLPNEVCKSLSPVTDNNRILTMRKNSVAMSLTYTNKDGDSKGRNAIYKDVYMRRLTSKQKFKLVLNNTHLQNILITEMISRLRAFIILHDMKIMDIEHTTNTFLTDTESRLLMEEQFLGVGRTKLEARLLSWSCMTGEMRNHMALCAHVDGNKSHPVETMTLLGRMSSNEKHDDSSTALLKDGYVIFPLDGVTLKLKCGQDIVHCCLKKTMHLADNTRNTCNWSRVHGP